MDEKTCQVPLHRLLPTSSWTRRWMTQLFSRFFRSSSPSDDVTPRIHGKQKQLGSVWAWQGEAGCGPDGSDGCPRKVNSGPVSSNFSWQQHVSNCFNMLARLLWCRAERFSRCVLPLFAAARLTRVKKNGHSFAGHGQETTSSPLPSEHTGWEELQCNVGNSMTILLGE